MYAKKDKRVGTSVTTEDWEAVVAYATGVLKITPSSYFRQLILNDLERNNLLKPLQRDFQ